MIFRPPGFIKMPCLDDFLSFYEFDIISMAVAIKDSEFSIRSFGHGCFPAMNRRHSFGIEK